MPDITINIAAKSGDGGTTMTTIVSRFLADLGYDVNADGEDRDAEITITQTQLPSTA